MSEARIAIRNGVSSMLARAAACLAVATAVGCGGVGGSSTAVDERHPLLGAPTPAFRLRDVVAGGEQSLEQHRGKVVVVDFWATWCEPCRQSFPAYQKLATDMGDKLVILGISQDDEPDGVAPFANETGAKFPLLWDEDKSVAKQYGPPTMPAAFVIDREGMVRFVRTGYRRGDEQELADNISSVSH